MRRSNLSCWANAVAVAVTLASKQARLDPAMIAAPLVATIIDMTSLLIYFAIANTICV